MREFLKSEPPIPFSLTKCENAYATVMNNVFGYIDRYSDSLFKEQPFCEVDALVFTWLSYFEIENLAERGIDCRLTLKNLVKKTEENLGEIKKPEKLGKLVSTATGAWMLKQVSDKKRFKGVRIGGFKTVNDHINGIQFSVTSYILDTGVEVISFRGTDTSVAGWKEDCMTSYSLRIPSQKLALKYLNMRRGNRPLIVTGHSKGGNLAIYAASKCHKSIVPRITDVYNFDGPGFCFDIKTTENFNEIKDRIHSYIPGSSIVGMLLQHMDDYAVVSSLNAGIMQHYAFYWKIEGRAFVRQEKRNLSSRSMDAAFKQWMADLSFEERKAFVETVFSVIEESGVKYFDDFSKSDLKALFSKINSMDAKSKKMFRSFLVKLIKASSSEVLSAASDVFGRVKDNVAEKVSNTLAKHFNQ